MNKILTTSTVIGSTKSKVVLDELLVVMQPARIGPLSGSDCQTL